MDDTTNVTELKNKVKNFSEERDWDQFHNPKDLAIGIITESSEILEHFRFKSDSEAKEMLSNKEKKQEIAGEVADTFYFILRLAQMHDIDLTTELNRMLEKNEKRYPVEKSKGSNKKYNEL